MNASRNLGLAAILLFLISYFLPAFGSDSGFACFGYCWEMLWGHSDNGWFYYGGFAVANIFFIGLVAAVFVTKNRGRFWLIISIILFLHVLSWWVLALFQKSSQVSEIQIGYYVWLTAYALLVVSYLLKKPALLLRSSPLAGSVV